MDDCVFCNYRLPKQVFTASKHFYALPALGQISNGGHVIVTPKKHYTCLGEMSMNDLEELDRFVHVLKGKMRIIYGPVASFEQGVNGQSVNHAHLQIVPVPSIIDVLPLLQQDIPNHVQLHNITELNTIHATHGPYAYYHPQNGLMHAFLPTEQLPNQYLRKTVAQALGKQKRGDWQQWRNSKTMVALDDTFIQKTIDDLTDAFKD